MNLSNILDRKEGKIKTKILSGIITLSVLGLLLLSGPINAFQIILGNFEGNYNKGEYISTIAQIKITSDERINPALMNFNITVNDQVVCSFDYKGTNISGCNDRNISIELLDSSTSYELGYGYQSNLDYGYGYNYGYEAYGYGYGEYGYSQGYSDGNFTYNITFDTSKLNVGNNTIRLETSLGSGHTYRSGEQKIDIKVDESKQYYATGTSENINNSNYTRIIFDQGSSSVRNITITGDVSSTQEITLDMGALLTNNKVNVSNEIRLERQTSTTKYIAEIPAGTVITGPTGWDGTMVLPMIVTQTSSLGKVGIAVDMGSSFGSLLFDNPVKVTIGQMAGKSAFYILPGDTTQHVITACSDINSDITTDSAGSLSDGECSISGNTDLYIWTYHFTTFAAYTPTTGGGSSTPAVLISNEETTTPTTGDVVTTPTNNTNPTTTGTTNTPITTSESNNKALIVAIVIGVIVLGLGLAYQFFFKSKMKKK